MFNFIKNKIKKIYNAFTSKAALLFSKEKIDEEFIKELEVLLISSDVGGTATKKIINNLVTQVKAQKIKTGQEIKEELHKLLFSELQSAYESKVDFEPKILLLVGINGSGKTTFAAKFANKLRNQGKKVLLVAADTFRAAATNQLKDWAQKIGVDIFIGRENQDPAAVVFDACNKFNEENYDNIIIDTAGRLQTKVNLMRELEKIRKIVERQLGSEQITSYLTLDAMLGQNSFEQAKIFNESTKLNGIVLTKLDGTGKGGIIFTITKELKLPIVYVSYGESVEDIKQFDLQEYLNDLLG